MEVTYMALILALLVLLVWVSKTINRYSEENYYYTPIGFATISLAMIPYALLIAGFFLFTEDPMNQLMSIILGVTAIIGLFWWIEHHSSFYVALGSIVILMIAGLLMVVFVLLSSGGSSDDDYYYD